MRFALLITVALGILIPAHLARADLTIGAAISLQSALEKARPDLEKAAGEPIQFTFGASGTIANQIRQGAPIDLFISADRPNVDKLTAARFADPATVTVIARNTLVVIVPNKPRDGVHITTFADLTAPSVKKIAIGQPGIVPAGTYAQETLTNLHLWDRLQKAGTLITAENVAQVLAYVSRGEVDAGLVYATDAQAAKSVHLVATAAENLHAPIEYVSVITSATPHRPAALAAQHALLAAPLQTILQDAGFAPPQSPVPTPESSPGIAIPAAPTIVPTKNPSYLRPWLLSLQVATIATLAAALLAVPLAYLLAKKRFPGRFALESLVILPLVLPPTVVGFLLMYVIGRFGLYGLLTGGHSLLFSLPANICAAAIVAFPLLVLPIRAAFAAIAPEFDEEAKMAGLSPSQRFLHVSLPLARGGLLSGLLLAFARALGEFGATLMLVGTSEKTRTLPLQIYNDAGLTYDFAAAWPAVLALAATSLLVILLANRLHWLDTDH